jgi:hypothetical protein
MAIKRNKKKKPAKSKKTARKKPARRKPAPKKRATRKTKAALRKAAPRKSALKKRRVRGRSQNLETVAFEPEGLRSRAGGQSGNLQGLSSAAGADSESVDELLEEGNAFEAEVVKGVQDAAASDEKEVVSHEVPEDPVPKE